LERLSVYLSRLRRSYGEGIAPECWLAFPPVRIIRGVTCSRWADGPVGLRAVGDCGCCAEGRQMAGGSRHRGGQIGKEAVRESSGESGMADYGWAKLRKKVFEQDVPNDITRRAK